MKHRFLIHSLNHTFLVVDITSIGLPTGALPQNGQERVVPTLRFRNWEDAKQYFLRLGAEGAALDKTSTTIRNESLAVLTIV